MGAPHSGTVPVVSDDDDLTLEVTAAITWYMRQHKISRRDLATRLGVTPGRVSQMLSGGQNLTLRTLESIAQALEARLDVSLVALGPR